LSFKTHSQDGLLLCAFSPGGQEEFLAIQIKNGRPYFLFDPQVMRFILKYTVKIGVQKKKERSTSAHWKLSFQCFTGSALFFSHFQPCFLCLYMDESCGPKHLFSDSFSFPFLMMQKFKIPFFFFSNLAQMYNWTPG